MSKPVLYTSSKLNQYLKEVLLKKFNHSPQIEPAKKNPSGIIAG